MLKVDPARIIQLCDMSMQELRLLAASYEYWGDNPPTNKEANQFKGQSKGRLIGFILQWECGE
jgi:hypothetical protein